MAVDSTTSLALQCGRCGSAYRRSYFDRQCSCPACGHDLQTGSYATAAPRLPRYLLAVAGLVTVVGIFGFGLKSVRHAPVSALSSEAFPIIDAPPPFKATPEFRDALNLKAKLLEQDLALAPEESFLVASLAETYLYRAMAEYQLENSVTKAEPWLRKSKSYVERLRGQVPFASYRLRDAIDHFPHLQFNSQNWPSITAALWRLQAGRTTLFAAPAPGGVPFIRRHRDVTGMPPPGDAPGGPRVGATPLPIPPPGRPSMPIFGDRPPSPAPIPFAYPGGAPATTFGNGPYSNAPVSGGPGIPLVEPGVAEADYDQRLAELRQQLTAQPTDLVRADRLAGELIRVSAAYQPALAQSTTQGEAQKRIEEAAKIYVRAAQTARLRVHRAAFYAAAADARRRLEQWEQQYELLQRTAEYAPFAPAVWRDLKAAALRLGKLDESITASKNEKRWQFPGIETVGEGNR